LVQHRFLTEESVVPLVGSLVVSDQTDQRRSLPAVMDLKLKGIRQWVGETLSHAIGNPREEKMHLPPPIGEQPFRDTPERAK
jgi:hypothetical protein